MCTGAGVTYLSTEELSRFLFSQCWRVGKRKTEWRYKLPITKTRPLLLLCVNECVKIRKCRFDRHYVTAVYLPIFRSDSKALHLRVLFASTLPLELSSDQKVLRFVFFFFFFSIFFLKFFFKNPLSPFWHCHSHVLFLLAAELHGSPN